MHYYIRFTDTPFQDLKRGVSYHLSDIAAVGYRFNKHFNCYAKKLAGLCAYALEAETEAEALEEASTFLQDIFNSQSDSDSYCVLTGDYITDCPEGVIIRAKKLLHIKKGKYYAE